MALPALAVAAAARILTSRAAGMFASQAARNALRASASRGALTAARRKPLPFLPPVWGDFFDWEEEAALPPARSSYQEGGLDYASSGWVHRAGCATDGFTHTTAGGVFVACNPSANAAVTNADNTFPNGQHYKSGNYWYARTVEDYWDAPITGSPYRKGIRYGNEYRMHESANPREPLPPLLPQKNPSSLPAYVAGVIPKPWPDAAIVPPMLVPEVQIPIVSVSEPVPAPRYQDVPKIHRNPIPIPSFPVFVQPSTAPVRPDIKPSQIPVISRGEAVVTRPNGVPRLSSAGSGSNPPPHDLRPPRKNEREAKVRAKGFATAAQAVRFANHVTEALDFVDVLYDALPNRLKPRYKDTRFVQKNVSPHVKMELIYKHWNKINPAEAIKGHLIETAKDVIFGRIGQGIRRNQKAIDVHRPVGWLAGPAL